MRNQDFVFPEALAQAEKSGSAMVFGMLDDQLFEWAIVPVMTPLPIGWVAVAQVVDHQRVEQLRRLSALPLHIGLGKIMPGSQQILTGTAPAAMQMLMEAEAGQPKASNGEHVTLTFSAGGSYYVSHLLCLPSSANDQAIVAALQIDFADGMTSWKPMFYTLLGLFLFGLFANFLGSILIARNLSRPVRALAGAGEEIIHGHFATPATAGQAR